MLPGHGRSGYIIIYILQSALCNEFGFRRWVETRQKVLDAERAEKALITADKKRSIRQGFRGRHRPGPWLPDPGLPGGVHDLKFDRGRSSLRGGPRWSNDGEGASPSAFPLFTLLPPSHVASTAGRRGTPPSRCAKGDPFAAAIINGLIYNSDSISKIPPNLSLPKGGFTPLCKRGARGDLKILFRLF